MKGAFMNNNNYYSPLYQNSIQSSVTPNQQVAPTVGNLYEEQSYIENILRLNKGKVGKFFMSYPDSLNWKDKTYTGVIEQSGRDHIIVSDPKTGKWYLLLLIYLDYVEFDEKINYIKNF